MPTELRFDDLDLREEPPTLGSKSSETDGTITDIYTDACYTTKQRTCLC